MIGSRKCELSYANDYRILAYHRQLKFTDVLLFQLRATLVGAVTFKDLSNADFLFDALFEQHILEYIHDTLMGQFDQARQAAENGIDAAQAEVDKARAAWQHGVDDAQASLDAAKTAWDSKNESITSESNKVIHAYHQDIERLEGDITSAQQEFDAAMAKAWSAVNAAERDRLQALRAAQHDVDNAKRAMNDAIDAAQRDVDIAERDFSAAFGPAIESARRDVQSLQNQINNIVAIIRGYYVRAPPWEFWKKFAIIHLVSALAALEASKAIADGILVAAEGVLTSASYITRETAFTTAKAALEGARQAGQLGIDSAQAAVSLADKTSRVGLDLAYSTLEATKQGVEWGVLEGAKQALQAYKDTNDAAFHAATQALVDLIKCSEFLAYQAAKATLDVARAATVALDTANAALDLARDVGEAAIDVGKWVADHALEAFDIRAVHLTGSLRGMIGADGSITKPFTAHVEAVVVGTPFQLDGEFNSANTADFISFIFKE